MAEADTLAYWNKLAAIRAAAPKTPAVAATVKQCNAFISADAIYAYRCPAAWLEYAGAPNATTAQLVFPRDFFNWVKSYLRAALSARPSSSSSAEFRVVWALDVWAHVQYGLLALPLPWSDIFSEGVGGVPELDLDAVYFVTGPATLEGEAAAATAWSNEKAAIERSSSSKTIRENAAQSRLNPSPFSLLAVRWCRAPGSRSPYFQKPNPLWPLLLGSIQPWSTADTWLQSRGNKDSSDIARWSRDPVLYRAAMQWRLWSAQDWGYVGYSDGMIDPTFWPYGMGKANAVVTLSSYIAHVKGEATAPAITFVGRQAYSNLAFGFESVSLLANRLLATDFDTVMYAHLTMWLARSAPRVNLDGSLRVRSDGAFERQPVTRTDYADYFKGLRKAITDRMRVALVNPVLACPPNDTACISAAKQGAKVNAAISTSPLAPVQGWMQKIADKLVSLLGAAVGGGYEPFFVLRDLFSRSFAAPGYRFATDGSSVDVMFRLALATENYKALIPQLFFAQAAPSNRVARASCKVHWTRSNMACEICDGQPRPACAADVPGLPSAPVAASMCEASFELYMQQNPQLRRCLRPDSRVFFIDLCDAVSRGEISAEQQLGRWATHLKASPCGRGGLLTALVSGFMRASNPLR